MDIKIISLQFVLFFRDIVERPDIEFKGLNENMLNLFNAIPQVIPVPRELPPDIPVLTLSSEAKDYICNISRSRIDLIYQRQNDEKSNSELLNDFNSKAAAFSKYVLVQQDIIRFGMVVRCFIFEDSPIEKLKQKYFTDKIGQVSELSLRFNQVSSIDGFVINDIVDIGVQKAIIENKEHDGILIQRDINNVIKEGRNITYTELQSISKKYAAKISENALEGLLQ